MRGQTRKRRFVAGFTLVVVALVLIIANPSNYRNAPNLPTVPPQTDGVLLPQLARDSLARLAIKGRASNTDYSRSQFGDGWTLIDGCDMRNIILKRDLQSTVIDSACNMQSGVLHDPYSGATIEFQRGPATSPLVQIDHVVALGDAWQKGAQAWPLTKRVEFANDPLELLAVAGVANQQKSNSDAASWLPSNKAFRCQYAARQIAIKAKYGLWVTQAEHDSLVHILDACPDQLLPVPQ